MHNPADRSEAVERIRVMVVDDELDIAFVLGQTLRPQYEPVLVPSGLDALDRVDRIEPDVIVMDVMMPSLDGFDTTRAIKKNAAFANVPVIFLTAAGDNESVREGMMAGGEVYLVKPFAPEELLAQLKATIAKHHVAVRAKRFTLDELERLYPFGEQVSPYPGYRSTGGGVTNTTGVRPKTLSEQMAQVGEQRLRVLAIDDDPSITSYIRTCLQDDFEVITTTDSESAPDKIIAYQPDILLLDIVMPKLNGFHLSHLMKINKRLRGARIIFISSRSDRNSMEMAFRMGASEFLEKPFTQDQLKRRIFDVTRKADFHRTKKRLTYSEIQMREGME